MSDGFRVEIAAAHERADIVLDRPPLNVITMPQRDELRAAFEALDADPQVRVIVVRAVGEHFSSGGEIRGFLEASPEHVSRLAWNIAAPARCTKPVIAASRGYCFGVGFELALACDFRIVSETCLYALPEQRLGRIPARAAPRDCRRSSASPAPRTSSCARAASPAAKPTSGAWPPTASPIPTSNPSPTRLVEELRGLPLAGPAHRQEIAQRHRRL